MKRWGISETRQSKVPDFEWVPGKNSSHSYSFRCWKLETGWLTDVCPDIYVKVSSLLIPDSGSWLFCFAFLSSSSSFPSFGIASHAILSTHTYRKVSGTPWVKRLHEKLDTMIIISILLFHSFHLRGSHSAGQAFFAEKECYKRVYTLRPLCLIHHRLVYVSAESLVLCERRMRQEAPWTEWMTRGWEEEGAVLILLVMTISTTPVSA